jgi:N-acetylneuraminic acid mutarotase
MDKTRIERALREGPPFRTHYVQQPLPLGSEVVSRPFASGTRPLPSVLIVAILLLTLALVGSALVGSGLIKLPVSVEASASASSTPHGSTQPSSTPVQQRPASWTATGSMIGSLLYHTATPLLDGTVLVTGGYSSVVDPLPSAGAELYDPSTRSWTPTGTMLKGRVSHTATLLRDGTVLVAGGSGGGVSLASAELFNPKTGTWSSAGSMIEPRAGHTATLLTNGRVLVAGGCCQGSSGNSLASAELYDPSTRTWRTAESMIGARMGGTGTLLLDGYVLVAGGGSISSGPIPSQGGGLEPIALASAELYDPSSGSWTPAGEMREARSGLTATVLLDGTVLVVGGSSLASAELYDPGTRSWTATGAMVEARVSHTATLLLDGKVLVAGGYSGSGGNQLASAELYDPGTRSWTATVAMSEARVYHTAARLQDGAVLVAGSMDGTGSPASAEMYDPGTGN